MSKFDFGDFSGGYDDFAVNKEKYNKEQAIKIYRREMNLQDVNGFKIAIGNGYVRHRAGRDEDNERRVCWWLEYEQHKRSCPAWIFHVVRGKDKHFDKDYEFINLD